MSQDSTIPRPSARRLVRVRDKTSILSLSFLRICGQIRRLVRATDQTDINRPHSACGKRSGWDEQISRCLPRLALALSDHSALRDEFHCSSAFFSYLFFWARKERPPGHHLYWRDVGSTSTLNSSWKRWRGTTHTHTRWDIYTLTVVSLPRTHTNTGHDVDRCLYTYITLYLAQAYRLSTNYW
jgi:hypothetical protein